MSQINVTRLCEIAEVEFADIVVETFLPAQHIPMSAPDLTPADLDAVNAVLRTPHLSIGPQIQAFDRATAEYVGVAHAAGVNSGTSGLHLALIAICNLQSAIRNLQSAICNSL